MFIEKSLEQRAESRQFFKSLFTIVGPIALQNLISAAVGSADVVMLGYVGPIPSVLLSMDVRRSARAHAVLPKAPR